MDLLSSELQATCSSLGTWDGKKYLKEPDALECVKDLIRYLKRDEGTHEIRRTLGSIGVFSSDIIHILRDFSEDEDLFDAALRLSVSLTSPELILFREELPEEKKTRNFYLELTHYRTLYKESLRDISLWSVLGKKLLQLLRLQNRSEDQDLLFERILILIRNVLQTPDRLSYVHDEIIWALHKAGVTDLILFIASSDDQITYCLHVLEIISLIFKDQDVEALVKASLDGKSEKSEHADALLEATKREIIAKKSKVRPTRHSRFGGTYVINNVASISGGNMIYHKAIQKSKDLSFDEEKRSKKKSLKYIGDDSTTSSSNALTSSMPVKVFLKEFCIEFLNAAYNVLMQTVRDLLNREKTQQNDDSYYLWSLRFFMKFNRLYKFRPELVSETLNRGIFHYVHLRIDHYKEFMSHEKKNPPKFKIWSKRLHLGLLSYQELLFNLVAMQNSKDPLVKRSGEVLTHSTFYESEYRELCLGLLLIYSPERMSLGYLKDLVETTHVYIKIIENMCKSKKLIIKKKMKKKSGKGKAKGTGAKGVTLCSSASASMPIPRRIDLWGELSSQTATLLVGPAEALPSDIPVLYDPVSDESMDHQRKKAICIIQKKIMEQDMGTAIVVLRSARDIWPENDIFGEKDIDPEDEAIILKDILLTEIEEDLLMAEDQQGDNEKEALNEENEEEIDEENEEEVEEEIVQTSESELNFKDFMRDFITKNVCIPYAVMFSNFKNNSAYTNHCVLKMFHRIAFDHKLSSMLFHITIFNTFRCIWKEYEESLACEKENGISMDKTLKEMVRFAKYVFAQFRSAVASNPKIFIELCFWKNVKEAIEVVEGYGTQTSSEKVKASYWSEEDEETLIRVFQQFMAMENKPEDILDSITMFFHESGKSRRQVARKLKGLGLIQNTKEITRKPVVNRRNEWTEEDIEDLKELYIEFADAIDPVSRIKERLKGRRSKPKIIAKLLELQICSDPEKLKRQSKSRSSKKKAFPEDSDSFGDTSSDDDANDTCLSLEEWITRFRDNLTRLKEAGFSEELSWIADILVEEAEDKDEEDEENESVPLIAMSESQGKALECPNFQSFLRDLNFLSPNAVLQEKYWRLNGHPRSLTSRASLIKDGLQSEFQNYSTLIPIFKKLKKEKTKRIWRPMKGGPIDQETLDRINRIVEANRPEPLASEKPSASPPKQKGKRKPRKSKPTSQRSEESSQRGSRDSDSSSDEEIPIRSSLSRSSSDDEGPSTAPQEGSQTTSIVSQKETSKRTPGSSSDESESIKPLSKRLKTRNDSEDERPVSKSPSKSSDEEDVFVSRNQKARTMLISDDEDLN